MPQKSFALPRIIDSYTANPDDTCSFDSSESFAGPYPGQGPARLFAVPPRHRSRHHSADGSPDREPQSGDLDPAQRSTLQAILDLSDAQLSAAQLSTAQDTRSPAPASRMPHSSPFPGADHRLALNELNLLCRTRAGYAFSELPHELQEAVLSLIASRDLASPECDLTAWLEDLRIGLAPTLSR